jgi:prolyl 4-hydroxylase
MFPYVELFDSFLSKEEIQSLQIDQILFEKSPQFDFTIKQNVIGDYRNSWTYHPVDDRFNFIMDRSFDLLKNYLPKLEKTSLERIQITKYLPGEYYKPHFDYFNIPPNHLDVVEIDRRATFIIYFNDNFENGTTFFPHLNLNIIPKAGSALFFRYDYDDPKVKSDTLHSGEVVMHGTKYIATIWIADIDSKNQK